MRWLHGIVLLILACGMASCSGDNAENDADAAVAAIGNYWVARVSLDEEDLYQYTCAARESLVPGEIQSLSTVQNMRLENFTCRQTGTAGADLIVTCDGELVADYGADDTNRFPMRSYLMTKENGEWKMCGEFATPQEEE
jgi:hypothetical protein